MPHYSELDSTDQALIVTCTVFGSLATAFTVARLTTRYSGEGEFGADDVLIVLALLFYHGNIALNVSSTVIGDGGRLTHGEIHPEAYSAYYLVSDTEPVFF